MSATQRFIDQNELTAKTVTAAEVEGWVEHHAGGLYVLISPLAGGRYVKMHDSWGDDGKVVVHTYHPDVEDGETDSEDYFDTGREAYLHFLRIANEVPYANDPLEEVRDITQVAAALHDGPFDVQPMGVDYKTDNRWRAAYVAHALKEYAGIVGTAHGEEVDTVISDFLGDLRHLLDCIADDGDHHRSNFDHLAARGRRHYEAEIRGEG